MIVLVAAAVCATHALIVLLSLSEYFGPTLVPHGHRAGLPLPGHRELPSWVITAVLAVLLTVTLREARRQLYRRLVQRVAVGLVVGGLAALLLDRLLDGGTTTYLGPFTIPDIALAVGLACWVVPSTPRRRHA